MGYPLHPLLAERWSPAVFDPEHEAPVEDVETLLEAARWAPSAGNAQPWAFLVGRRGDPVHGRLVRHLAGSSAGWAPSASVLVANLAHRFVEDTDWEFSEFALYDLGQAVAHMTIQAQALGLRARQFRAFDRAGLAAEFARARALGGHDDDRLRASPRRQPDPATPHARRDPMAAPRGSHGAGGSNLIERRGAEGGSVRLALLGERHPVDREELQPPVRPGRRAALPASTAPPGQASTAAIRTPVLGVGDAAPRSAPTAGGTARPAGRRADAVTASMSVDAAEDAGSMSSSSRRRGRRCWYQPSTKCSASSTGRLR